MTESAPPAVPPSDGGANLSAPRLVLASGSPRRRELLAALGLAFTVRPVDLDETPHPGERPHDYVLRLAREKAAARALPGELVLAADTVVVLEGSGGPELLGKPSGPAEARTVLARLAGREHTVLTGVALELPDPGGGAPRRHSAVAASQVAMGTLGEEEIAWYVDTGEPLDKAGSYGIQGIGALYVEEVRGNYTNVVGLPLPLVRRLLGEAGFDVRRFLAA
ncbi:MAG TPA: Maf family protein, partial [Thermoanaerobaculia bacterium]|nr:Maf family protein [Thermoanaerobaculia bacterium]